MISVSYIEKLCEQNNLHSLPALQQLKNASKYNNKEDVERISKNILSYLEEVKGKELNYER